MSSLETMVASDFTQGEAPPSPLLLKPMNRDPQPAWKAGDPAPGTKGSRRPPGLPPAKTWAGLGSLPLPQREQGASHP